MRSKPRPRDNSNSIPTVDVNTRKNFVTSAIDTHKLEILNSIQMNSVDRYRKEMLRLIHCYFLVFKIQVMHSLNIWQWGNRNSSVSLSRYFTKKMLVPSSKYRGASTTKDVEGIKALFSFFSFCQTMCLYVSVWGFYMARNFSCAAKYLIKIQFTRFVIQYDICSVRLDFRRLISII